MTREEINARIIILLEKFGIIPPLIPEEQENSLPENQTCE
jgi:hypothetical protein